ncbi:hypothetical protein UFOVP144_5 [uncultured Caudovirales phage]|uniref:Uncharacterized protein n=1 Tax=uncultured Caudovirales phage TaxID=2100421 RepID=A0A6J7XV12_9CAUD|nr:hypothetical protein UFOVP144_5 [uncultured Caudovirales phage]
MANPKQSGQPSGGMFQKYTGEQINQIPEGYVQGMGAMGQAYASIGQSIGAAAQAIGSAYGQQKMADAKLQATVAPYLKQDARVQMIDASVAAGNVVKGADGAFTLAPGIDQSMLSPGAKDALDFYNKIGGDGSALSGAELTKFATQFETEQKIATMQSDKADKAIDRAYKAAQIKELESKAVANYGKQFGAAVAGAFASGQSIPAFNGGGGGQAQAPAQQMPQQEQIAQAFNAPVVTPTVNQNGLNVNVPGQMDLSRYGVSPVYGTDRAQAGAGLTASLSDTSASINRYNLTGSVSGEQQVGSVLELPREKNPQAIKQDIEFLKGQIPSVQGSPTSVQTLQDKIAEKEALLKTATAVSVPTTSPVAQADNAEITRLQGSIANYNKQAAVATDPIIKNFALNNAKAEQTKLDNLQSKYAAPTAAVEQAKPVLTAAQRAETDFQHKAVQVARVQAKQRFEADVTKLDVDYQNAMKALAGVPGVDSKQIKDLTDIYTARSENLRKNYAANIEYSTQGIAEERAAASEGRAVAGEARTGTEFSFKYGQPEGEATPAQPSVQTAQPTTGVTQPSQPTAQATTATARAEVFKPGSFAEKQDKIINGASQGRVGGTETAKAQDEAYNRHMKVMGEHPAWWQNGMFTQGAAQYQYAMANRPTAQPIDSSVKVKVQEEVSGYVEAQTFLTTLQKTIESGSDSQIKNYLDRMLWTTSDVGMQATGDMLNQFGVAAFRRAIVSGGNFSDADREYVAKIITDINSLNPIKDKTQLLAKTKALASFIDGKYRATLSTYGVKIDLDTSRKFLEREGQTQDLEVLDKSQQYYKMFNLDYRSKPKTIDTSMETPSGYLKLAEGAEKVGNTELAKGYRERAKLLKDELTKSRDEATKRLTATPKK